MTTMIGDRGQGYFPMYIYGVLLSGGDLTVYPLPTERRPGGVSTCTPLDGEDRSIDDTEVRDTVHTTIGIDDTTYTFGSIEQVHEGTDKSLCGVFCRFFRQKSKLPQVFVVIWTRLIQRSGGTMRALRVGQTCSMVYLHGT